MTESDSIVELWKIINELERRIEELENRVTTSYGSF